MALIEEQRRATNQGSPVIGHDDDGRSIYRNEWCHMSHGSFRLQLPRLASLVRLGCRSAGHGPALTAILAGLALVLGHPSQSRAGDLDLTGTWQGTYTCGQVLSNVTLSVTLGPNATPGNYVARFVFRAPGADGRAVSGEYEGMLWEPKGNHVAFRGWSWIQRPAGFAMTGFDAEVSADLSAMQGALDLHGCGTISIHRTSTSAAPMTLAESGAPVTRAWVGQSGPKPLPATVTGWYIGTWDGMSLPDSGSSDGGRRLTLELSEKLGRLWVDDSADRLVSLSVGPGGGDLFVSTSPNPDLRMRPSGQEFRVSFYANQALAAPGQRDAGNLIRLNAFQWAGHTQAGYLFRRTDTIPGGSSLQSWCDQGASGWLHDRLQAANEARDLRTRYFDEIGFYQEGRAGLVAILSDEVFTRRFGKPVNQMDDAAFDALMHGLRFCALTDPQFSTLLKRGIIESVIDAHALFMERNGSWTPTAPSLARLDGAMRRADAVAISVASREATAHLPSIAAELHKATTVKALQAAFEANSSILINIPPPQMSTLLAALQERIDILSQQNAAAAAEARHRVTAERMMGVTVPDAAIPPERRPVVDAIARGDLPRTSLEDRSFLGGMTDEAVVGCKVPLTSDERTTLKALADEAAERASVGTQFTDSGGMSSAVKYRHDYVEGTESIHAMTCASPFVAAFLANLAIYLDAARRSIDTGAPLFIRSCAQVRSKEDCECIARYAQTVDDNIYDQPYSPSIIAGIAGRDPITALRMGMQCHVGNY